MYPRNAASPERIAVGAVVQISDGAVQTSGVSIKVKPQGASASSGGGTTSYEEGFVEYTPTQAETNYTSFEVLAYKTGCIPAGVTVVTTASVTPGRTVPLGANGDTLESLSAQISGIGSGTGAALNFAVSEDNSSSPIKSVASIGTQTGTYTNTLADDASSHQIASVGNAIDWVYGFSTGAGRAASKVVLRGNMAATGDTVTVSAYNFSTTSWDARTTITGIAETLRDIPLLAAHTGSSGADTGKVYIRCQFSEADAGTLVIDEAYVQAQQAGSLIGYADGAVWVRAAGTSGTTPYQNGTADNPCPWADAVVLAAALGLGRFRILPDETVTLAASLADKTIIGEHWYLALGSQSVNDCYIKGAVISGVASGTDHSIYEDCEIGTGAAGATMPPGKFLRCGFNTPSGQPLTAASAGQFVFVDGFSLVAGSGTPYFTFGGACGVNFRRWSGGSNITLDNTGAALTMEVVTGGGQTIACGGADVEVRGICRAVTLSGITTDTTAQIAAVTGPISLAGADGTVRVYGTHSGITDARTGTPTLVNLASASQTSVDDIPTNAELATALAGADDTVLAAIAALNNLSSAGAQAAAAAALAAYDVATGSDVPSASTVASAVRSELTTELARVDVATSTRLAAVGYTAPANSDVAAIKAKTDNLPSDPADASDVATAIAGLASTLATIQGYVDDLETRITAARAGYLDKLNVPGTLAHSDAAATYRADVSAVALETTAQSLKVVLDKLATMLEQDGGVYRYTTNALEQAPTGAGASPEDIADAVWDEALSGHAAAGSAGSALSAAGVAGDPMTAPMGGYDEGTAGYELHELYDQVMAALPDYPSIEVPAPPTAEQTTAWIRCLDEHGAPEGGVTIQVRLVCADEGTDAYDTSILSAVSASVTGLWSQAILRGSGFVYEARRGASGRWVRFRSANAPTVLLPAVLGQ